MVEGGIEDYSLAKRKAADRLRVSSLRLMPGNDEIEAAREAYQRLFRAGSQPQHLARMRRHAVSAMRLLRDFKPRLVGPVLSGTADDNSPVTLHLFADTDEEVAIFLLDQRIHHDSGERRLRVGSGEPARLASFTFAVDGIEIEFVVFSGRWRRQQPLSPVDGRPMERANLARVQALLMQSTDVGRGDVDRGNVDEGGDGVTPAGGAPGVAPHGHRDDEAQDTARRNALAGGAASRLSSRR